MGTCLKKPCDPPEFPKHYSQCFYQLYCANWWPVSRAMGIEQQHSLNKVFLLSSDESGIYINNERSVTSAEVFNPIHDACNIQTAVLV